MNEKEFLVLIQKGSITAPLVYSNLQEVKNDYREFYQAFAKLPPTDVQDYTKRLKHIAETMPAVI